MTNVFGATSTTDEVLFGVNLQGKRVLVTGVSAGIGVETARSLAVHGAHVVGAARDLTKAEAATAQVRMDAAANGGSFDLVALDLASLKSVRACADGLLKKAEPFDGWYYYLEDKIRFPFQAKCIASRVTSPLLRGESVEVRALGPEDTCGGAMLVLICWQCRPWPAAFHR